MLLHTVVKLLNTHT